MQETDKNNAEMRKMIHNLYVGIIAFATWSEIYAKFCKSLQKQIMQEIKSHLGAKKTFTSREVKGIVALTIQRTIEQQVGFHNFLRNELEKQGKIKAIEFDKFYFFQKVRENAGKRKADA